MHLGQKIGSPTLKGSCEYGEIYWYCMVYCKYLLVLKGKFYIFSNGLIPGSHSLGHELNLFFRAYFKKLRFNPKIIAMLESQLPR